MLDLPPYWMRHRLRNQWEGFCLDNETQSHTRLRASSTHPRMDKFLGKYIPKEIIMNYDALN